MYRQEIVKQKFFSQNVRIRKKISNKEIKLFKYFHDKTGYYPENVLCYDEFVFFFVSPNNYFSASKNLDNIRKELSKSSLKTLIVRNERNIIKLLFSFFPDIYIHDVIVEASEEKTFVVYIYFLTYQHRGIAVGREGKYIKMINDIFHKYVQFDNKFPLEIRCDFLYI